MIILQQLTFPKGAAIASSLLLVGGLVANRAGLWQLSKPTPLAISATENAIVQNGPDEHSAEHVHKGGGTLMSSSKSGVVFGADDTNPNVSMEQIVVPEPPSISFNDTPQDRSPSIPLEISATESTAIRNMPKARSAERDHKGSITLMSGSKSVVGVMIYPTVDPHDTKPAVGRLEHFDLPDSHIDNFNDIPSLSQPASNRVHVPLQSDRPSVFMSGSKSIKVFTPPAQISVPSVDKPVINAE